MDFPSLRDSTFPHLQTVDVYANKNDIDYSKYTTVKNVTLTHVLWDNEYNNVVDWRESEHKREDWFAAQRDMSIELATGFAHPVLTAIKLPLSYADSQHYNYLYYTLPLLQNPGSVLDYQPTETQTFYYFITDTRYIAPNTTEFECQLDVWTTWVERLKISYMQLERGHYAIANSADVDTYLQSPITHTDMLLADDVVYGSASGTVISGAQTYPLEVGESFVVFVSTMGYADFLTMAAMVPPDTVTVAPPDFTNGVDLNWGYSGFDYTGHNVPMPFMGSSDGRLMGSLYNYAVEADTAMWFIRTLTEYSPEFLMTLQCAYSIRKAFVDIEYTTTYGTYEVHYVHGVYGSKFADINLTRELWNYPQKYANLTKLYTAPYTLIEIEDGNGGYTVIEPEKCGVLDIQMFVSLCFPVIHAQACINGLCGNGGGAHYNVIKLSDDIGPVIIPNGDWHKYLIEWDVPCFAVYITERDLTDYTRQPYTESVKYSTGISYNNTVRAADAAYQNSVDAANTAYSNTTDSADTELANVNRTNSTALANLSDSINTALSLTALADGLATDLTQENGQFITDTTQLANDVQDAQTQIQNVAATATTTTQMIGSMAQAGVSVLQNATNPTGLLGAVGGVAVAGIGAIANGATNMIMCNANSSQAAVVKQRNSSDAAYNLICMVGKRDYDIGYRDDTTDVQNAYNSAVGNRNANNSNTNAAATNATVTTNAGRTQATAISNAARTQGMQVANAQDSVRSAQATEGAEYERASHSRVVPFGQYGGDMLGDVYSRRSVRVKVRTMQTDAIRQNGDYFLRYGYAFNGNVEPDNLQPMRHYCYWKCADAWVTGTESTASTMDAVRAIFIDGTTVWSNPE